MIIRDKLDSFEREEERLRDRISSLKDQIDCLRLTEKEREEIRSNIFDIEDEITYIIKKINEGQTK